jgi:tetratricopeptide (TPR) repeat protein
MGRQMVALLGSLFAGLLMPPLVQANDSSPLCSNRQMTTEVALSTPEYFAGICSTGYVHEDGCYLPTAYFYVGQSRSTKESIVLPATIDKTSTPGLTVYKAIATPMTYQMATSGTSTAKPWTSFSVFENGARSYHHLADQYFGYRSCFPTPKLDGLFIPQPILELPDLPLQPAPSLAFEILPTVTDPTWFPQKPVSLPSIFTQREDEEIDRYNQQLKANPGDQAAYLGRANRNYELKRYQEAIADYGSVIRLKPHHVLAHFNRGVTNYRTGDFNGAIADYSVAIDHAPEWFPLAAFYNNWGLAYSSAFYSDQGLSLLTKAIELDPDYAMAYHNRGVLQHQQLSYTQAIADYTTAMELDPSFVDSYLHRGRAYYEQQVGVEYESLEPMLVNRQQYMKAIADYSAAIKLDPQKPVAYFQRGIVNYRLKNYDQAIADYSEAIALNPNYLDAYNNRGIAYAEGKHDYGRAIFDFQRTKEKDPQYAAGYYNLAVGYSALTPDSQELINSYYEQAIALNHLYQDYPSPEQQQYAFTDTRQLIPIFTEIIVPISPNP